MTIGGDGEPSSISGLRPLAVADEPSVESGDERLASTQALRHSVLFSKASSKAKGRLGGVRARLRADVNAQGSVRIADELAGKVIERAMRD